MTENSPNLHQKPSRLDRIKSIARNTGAVAESAAVAITGVAAFEAAVDTGPAYAGTEVAATHEGYPSGQAFIKGFNVKFAAAAQDMHTSPHYKSVSVGQVDKATGKQARFQVICSPSEQYKGLYDCLDVAVVKGQPVPEGADMYLGADSNSFTKIKKWKRHYYVGTTAGPGLGKWLALTEQGTPDSPNKNFFVSAGAYTGSFESGDVKYSQDPKAVSTAYNGFLNRMKALIHEK